MQIKKILFLFTYLKKAKTALGEKETHLFQQTFLKEKNPVSDSEPKCYI